MRRYLVDTQVLLWTVKNDRRIPERLALITRDGTACHASMASLWEVAIKAALGKLSVPFDFDRRLEALGVAILPIERSHVAVVRSLPHHHNDPFDRMIVAQAKVEGLTLVSADRQIARYDVDLIH